MASTVIHRLGNFHDPDQILCNLTALNDQRNISQFCDVVLRVSGTQIFAHSNVLAAASPYFSSFLGTGTDCPRMFSQKHPQIIEIHIDSNDGDGGYGEAVSKVVEFMYTSKISLTTALIAQIIEIGKIMQMERLLQFCDMFQRGFDDNSPRSIGTSTSGLREVADLLGSRSKIVKRASVYTETEESMFQKLKSYEEEPVSLDPFKDSELDSAAVVLTCSSISPKMEETRIRDLTSNVPLSPSSSDLRLEERDLPQPESSTMQDKEQLLEETPEPALSPSLPQLSFETVEQNEASLLLEIGNVRPSVKQTSEDGIPTSSITDSEAAQSSRDPNTVSIVSLPSALSVGSDYVSSVTASSSSGNTIFPSLPSTSSDLSSSKDQATVVISDLSTDEGLSKVKTLADMLNITADHSSTELDSCQITGDYTVTVEAATFGEGTTKESVSQLDQQNSKDVNLDDISDLVTFDPVTTAFLHSLPSSQGRGTRSRPRLRKRGRGRGRGRGRPRGRPKKVLEESDSEHEFEKLMERLENGDRVEDAEEPSKVHSNEAGAQSSPDTEAVSEEICDTENNVTQTDVKEESLAEKVEDPDYIPVKKDALDILKDTAAATAWKSPRVRSRPSQLKKDYVLHSFTKKTRRETKVLKLKHERMNSMRRSIKQNSEDIINKTTGLMFVCQKCDFTTPVLKAYRGHMKMHPETDPRYQICDKCDFKTTKSREYTAHKQSHMTQELICTFCEHQSETEEQFWEHKSKHEGSTPYFCTECDSRFRTRTQLLAHKPKHQVEKPYVCAVCSAGFKWKHALKSHMITHSATKDHLCDVCGYATAHKSQLKAHKLVHTGETFKCSIQGCQFEATKRQNLKYHMVTHTNEKPHQCDICGQSFSLIKNMRRHMLLHTDARPYACKLCSFTTTRYDKLKEHNHKLHNIGEGPVSKKLKAEEKVTNVENLDVLNVNSEVTYVASEGITINADGTISNESLRKIALLATSNSLEPQETTINIAQETSEDGSSFPIIATVYTCE